MDGNPRISRMTDLISSPDVRFLSTRYVDLRGNLRASRSATARPTTPGEDQIRGRSVSRIACSPAPMTRWSMADSGVCGDRYLSRRFKVWFRPQTHPIFVLCDRVESRFDRSHRWSSWETRGSGGAFLYEATPEPKVG